MSAIWKMPISVELVNQRANGSMSEFLGIRFTEVGDNFLCASMPVEARVRQPIGIMHGGASCVLAETVGSTAANYCVDIEKNYCVGLDINTNHIRSIREGMVFAIAKPFHIGSKTQVWGIEIKNEEGKLISINRLTMAVLTRKLES